MVWRGRTAWGAALVAAVPVVFGLLFGIRTQYGDTQASQLQWLTGIAVLAFAFGWLVWRPLATRRRQVRQVQGSVTTRVQGRWHTIRLVRGALGVLMVGAALGVSLLVAPTTLDGRVSAGFRQTVDPQVSSAAQQSPLVQYRNYFGDDMYGEELFTVEQLDGGSRIDRVRVATMPDYDGHMFAVTQAEGSQVDGGEFLRLPALVPASEYQLADTGPTTVDVRVRQYEGVWVPVPGALAQIAFAGPHQAALNDGFYFDRTTDTGLVTRGLTEGDSYRLDAYPYLLPEGEVASFTPGTADWGLSAVPDSVEQWVKAQGQPDDGAGLLELVRRLRARGYLSHGLTEDDKQWLDDLKGRSADYQFERSRAGHSLDRVDVLFTDLVERQQQAGEDAEDEELVAAVGDDEQFAAAVALLANQMGFNARVVLGARLAMPDGEEQLTVCHSEQERDVLVSTCKGADMAVWVEVQNAEDHRWAALDVTPQYEVALEPTEEQQSPPKHGTDVPEDTVRALPPPQPKPSVGEGQAPDAASENAAPGEAVEVARYVGITVLALFILASPLLAVTGAKVIRRQRRKRDPSPVRAAVGAWSEYLDYATDLGLRSPASATRIEQARVLAPGDPAAQWAAGAADFAAFAWVDPIRLDTDATWQAATQARRDLGQRFTVSKRLRARLSPRSFIPKSQPKK